MRRTLLLPGVFSLVVVAACQPSGAPALLSTVDDAAIRAIDTVWMAAAKAGDANALTSLYTTDAMVLPQGMPPQMGTEAIRQFWGRLLADGGIQAELRTTRIEGRQDLAYAFGLSVFRRVPKTPGGPAEPAQEGKYLEVLRRQPDGRWKLLADMFSLNAMPRARE